MSPETYEKKYNPHGLVRASADFRLGYLSR